MRKEGKRVEEAARGREGQAQPHLHQVVLWGGI